MFRKILKTVYHLTGFTGVWLVPVLLLLTKELFPAMKESTGILIGTAVIVWTSFNNFWSVTCEGKSFEEIGIGDGLIPDTGLKKESPQKRTAMYPKVPAELLSKDPEGVILGNHKTSYVRIPFSQIYHSAIIGGSGSGKTSTIILGTLLSNFAAGKDAFNTFAVDIKGELHQKSTYAYSSHVLVVNPSDRASVGWDAYYRLHQNPSSDLIIEAMEEIAQALIVSTNPKDRFFVENARTMFTGLLVYYFKQGESFIDSVNKILEAEMKSLIAEIIGQSESADLWYKYLAKFSGKNAESVEDCMVEMTTSLSVFSKSDIRFCFRDNFQKASPYDLNKDKSIFLAIPEHLLDTYQAILRLCTAQTLQELQRRSEEETKPVLVLIDEFARMGRIETIFNALATLRSKKVMVMLAFQSLAQCEVIYSREEARVLMENCRLKIICECSDPQTAKSICDWCGTYKEKKETLNGGKNRHKTYSYEDKPIVETGDLVTLTKKEEVIVIAAGTGYLRLKKCYYFKDKKLSVLAKRVREQNQMMNEV